VSPGLLSLSLSHLICLVSLVGLNCVGVMVVKLDFVVLSGH
jgi:hypothetical protein